MGIDPVSRGRNLRAEGDTLSRDARKGGMAFGAHEPPRTRAQTAPVPSETPLWRRTDECRRGGRGPRKRISRSIAGNGKFIFNLLRTCRSVVQHSNSMVGRSSNRSARIVDHAIKDGGPFRLAGKKVEPEAFDGKTLAGAP